MSDISVTVLIPTKDRLNLLQRAVASVLTQNTLADEIVVINDGSTDGTRVFLEDISQKYLRVKTVNHNTNRGVNAARNEGISVSTSEWTAFLDDDDELFPDAIATMKKILPTVPSDIHLIFFNTLIDTGHETFIGGYQFENNQLFKDLEYESFMIKKGLRGDCKPVFRTSLFYGGHYTFPESVNGFESYTMYLISRDGKGIRCYSDVLTHTHLEQSFDHLSFSASKKNPSSLLLLHQKQLIQHADFYRSHSITAQVKYKTMAKLAIRSRQPIVFLKTVYGYFLSKLELLKNKKRLPASSL